MLRCPTLTIDRVGQLLAQQRVEGVLEALVERRGGLVEEHDARAGEQHAPEAEPLLLAGGEAARPVGLLVEPVGEMEELDLLQHPIAGSSSTSSAVPG